MHPGHPLTRLPDLDDEEEDPDETLDIDVDVNNTAAANARWFYQAAKDAKAKEVKTMEVSAEWIKRAAKCVVTVTLSEVPAVHAPTCDPVLCVRA